MKTLYHGSSEIIDNPQFGKGNPKYIVGKSGIEIAMDILGQLDCKEKF